LIHVEGSPRTKLPPGFFGIYSNNKENNKQIGKRSGQIQEDIKNRRKMQREERDSAREETGRQLKLHHQLTTAFFPECPEAFDEILHRRSKFLRALGGVVVATAPTHAIPPHEPFHPPSGTFEALGASDF
jgi:hypothetical protein